MARSHVARVSQPTPLDFGLWGFILAIIALILSAFSVVAEYIGLFRKQLKIPVGQMVIVYQNNDEVIGGKVTSRTHEEITIKDAFRIAVHPILGGAEPSFEPTAGMGDIQVPVSTIVRWSQFPESLVKRWENLPKRQGNLDNDTQQRAT